jgi:hypothetical protein
MAKYCIDCGEGLSGRADKKYCSDFCRNNYNNKINGDVNNQMRNINNALRKNRRIMDDLSAGETVTVHIDKLIELGFHFSFYTHTYTTKKSDVYYICYDYGYKQHDNKFVTIVTRRWPGHKVPGNNSDTNPQKDVN